jgi:hypothetical protein
MTSGRGLLQLAEALPPLAPVVVRSSGLSRIHFPASLRSTVVTRFAATTDALTPARRLFGPFSHEHRLSLTGLPDYRGRTAGHSVSNHRRNVRGSPGCQRIDARPDRLRLSLAGSPAHTDRIEFTADSPEAALGYGLVVLVPLLSTPPHGDAVTVRYRTALAAQEQTFTALSPRLLRRTSAGNLPAPSGNLPDGTAERILTKRPSPLARTVSPIPSGW